MVVHVCVTVCVRAWAYVKMYHTQGQGMLGWNHRWPTSNDLLGNGYIVTTPQEHNFKHLHQWKHHFNKTDWQQLTSQGCLSVRFQGSGFVQLNTDILPWYASSVISRVDFCLQCLHVCACVGTWTQESPMIRLWHVLEVCFSLPCMSMWLKIQGFMFFFGCISFECFFLPWLCKHCVLVSLQQNPNKRQEMRRSWSPITTTLTI